MSSGVLRAEVNKSFGLILWVIFFCYSCCAALVFQKMLLPIISPESAGTGLLPNDAAYFHEVAARMAAEMREFGWERWKIFPAQGASGNVAILSLVYAIFGSDPAFIIPINAAIHALGGVLIYLITRELAENQQVGTYAGIVAATLFVFFPSALNWYGQLHKDGYAIAGLLLVFLGILRVIGSKKKPMTTNYFLVIAGIFMAGIARPYNLKLLLLVTAALLIGFLFASIYKRSKHKQIERIIFLAVTSALLAGSISVLSSLSHAEAGDTYASWSPESMKSLISNRNEGLLSKGNEEIGDYFALPPQIESWQWESSNWLPGFIDQRLETVARTRMGLIAYGLYENAGSMIDIDRTPNNALEVATYLPRALQLASFAPFPNTWLVAMSPTRLVAAFEMLIYYLCLLGLPLLLLYNRSSLVLFSLGFASIFLIVHGFTIANLGTLYRLRYAYEFILISIGVLGWATWIYKSGRFDRWLNYASAQIKKLPPAHEELVMKQADTRKSTIGSSVSVMLLTLICFLGFFARDIMMANAFGLGKSLDYFFIALMIPMFLVTVFAMPLGSAFVPFYLELKERISEPEVNRVVKEVASYITWGFFAVCLGVYFASPVVYEFFYKGENIAFLQTLTAIALPLLLLSGAMILGNSILNANGRAVFSSAAQLVVPLVAVLALIVFGETYGVVAVMYGMVIGQVLNLAIVQLWLRRYKANIIPEFNLPKIKYQSELHKQYWPLVGSVLFIAVATPVATLLAMTLGDGAVSAFNLGNKVVLFITGLLGAVVTTVMLPYFSRLMAKNNLLDARRELSFFLLLATFISVPLGVFVYMFSGQIVDLMLAGGSFSAASQEQVTRVMQYSVIQLPFYACNALLLRFAISTKHAISILVIAIFGLSANVLFSVLFMKHMGVAGIALGGSVGVLLSTAMLALMLLRYWHITLLDLIIMLLSWLLFITLLMGIHFQNMPSVYIVVIAYIVLMTGYMRTFGTFTFWKRELAS